MGTVVVVMGVASLIADWIIRACYFEVSCDNGTPEKIRSSGLLVFTGTGSTSW